jgi:hypothetical protein
MALSRKKLVVSEEDGFLGGYLIKQLLWDGVPVTRPVNGKARSEWPRQDRISNRSSLLGVATDLCIGDKMLFEVEPPPVNILGSGVSAVSAEIALNETESLRDQARSWMKRRGLHWPYRLCKKPKRWWRRYLRNNPKFAWLAILQLIGRKKFPPADVE